MSSRKNKTSSAIRKTAKPVQLEQLEERQYRSGNQDIGINVNDSSAAGVAKAIPILHQLGVTSVRLWAGIKDINSHTMVNGMQRAIDYHNAGFDVTLTVALDNTNVPDPNAVKSWFQWAVTNKTLLNAVNRWEIGNEVDSSYYFKGTLKQYVDNVLKPAASVLRPAGEDVMSAGVSWNPQDIQEMIDDGMLNYVDEIGFHPYANGVGSQKTHIQQVNAIVDGRKPLVATEWNVRGYEKNPTQWAQAVQDAYAQVHDGFALDYYYCLWKVNSPAGPGGLVTESNLQVNQLFWNAFTNGIKNYAASHGGTSTGGGSNGGGSTGGGSTPAGVGASISGVLWGDSNANGAIDGTEPMAGGRVVFLDTNGDGKLESGEISTTTDASGHYKFSNLKAGTYKVSRVYPSGYKISNSTK
ncbi:MAG: SdrD B-like domain-containing protein, partial [Tepidisphaeraceae bacterium]